jgi:hypothetical protein
MKSLTSHLQNHLHQHEYYDSTRTANQKLSIQLNQSTESNSRIYQTNKEGKVVLKSSNLVGILLLYENCCAQDNNVSCLQA